MCRGGASFVDKKEGGWIEAITPSVRDIERENGEERIKAYLKVSLSSIIGAKTLWNAIHTIDSWSRAFGERKARDRRSGACSAKTVYIYIYNEELLVGQSVLK